MAHWAELFPGRVHSMPLATVLHSPLAAFQQLATALQLNDGPGCGLLHCRPLFNFRNNEAN
jgi:hypothetical protein